MSTINVERTVKISTVWIVVFVWCVGDITSVWLGLEDWKGLVDGVISTVFIGILLTVFSRKKPA